MTRFIAALLLLLSCAVGAQNIVNPHRYATSGISVVTTHTDAVTVGTNTQYTVNLPASLQDDVWIIATSWDGWVNASHPIAPTDQGWTHIKADGTSDTKFWQLSYKRMGVTPDTTVNIAQSSSASNEGAFCGILLRGVNQTTVLDVAVPAEQANAATSTPDGGPSITPTTAGAWVGSFVQMDNDSGTLTSEPTGYDTITSVFKATGTGSETNNSSICAIAFKAWTSGAEDPGNWTFGTANDAGDSVTFAIRPQ